MFSILTHPATAGASDSPFNVDIMLPYVCIIIIIIINSGINSLVYYSLRVFLQRTKIHECDWSTTRWSGGVQQNPESNVELTASNGATVESVKRLTVR